MEEQRKPKTRGEEVGSYNPVPRVERGKGTRGHVRVVDLPRFISLERSRKEVNRNLGGRSWGLSLLSLWSVGVGLG